MGITLVIVVALRNIVMFTPRSVRKLPQKWMSQ